MRAATLSASYNVYVSRGWYKSYIILYYYHLQVRFPSFQDIYLILLNSLGIVFGNKRANASNLFLARNFCFAVTKTAYGIVGSVRIGMVYCVLILF